jgi:FkbM family methyltransferase
VVAPAAVRCVGRTRCLGWPNSVGSAPPNDRRQRCHASTAAGTEEKLLDDLAFELMEIRPSGARAYKLAMPIGARDAHEQDIIQSGAGGAVLDILLRLAKAKSIVLDIGANLGTITLPLAMNGVRVVAYDIVQENIESLARSAAANGLDDLITLRHAAAWHENGTVKTAAARSLGAVNNAGCADVQALRIDSDSSWHERVTAIKLDIEGAELNALTGMSRIIDRWRPHIVFESFPPGMFFYGASTTKVFKFLDRYGYRIYRLGYRILTPSSEVTEHAVTDYFATAMSKLRTRFSTGYKLRDLSDDEIIGELKCLGSVPEWDFHRIYVLSIADHLRESVREHKDVKALISEWAGRYRGDPRIAQYRQGVFAQ